MRTLENLSGLSGHIQIHIFENVAGRMVGPSWATAKDSICRAFRWQWAGNRLGMK
jgi:hypothetical protein